MKSTAVTLLIVGVGLLAMAVCLWIGLQQSVWFDEAYSIMVAKQAPHEIIRLAAIDTHPPLYYLLLHYWGELFQWNVVMLRMLSVMAYGGTILVAGLLMRRLFSGRIALWGVVLAVLSPLLMRYGFELRMYALASLIGVAATLLLVLARSATGRRAWWLWFGYAVLVAIGVYTVYYLALLWIAHLVWLVVTSRRELKKNLWRQPWLYAYGVSLLLFLPWLPTMLKQVTNGALAPIGQPMNVENLLGVLSFNTLYQPIWQFDMLRSILFMGLVGALVVVAVAAYRQLRTKEKPALLLLLCYIGVPILLLMMLSIVRSMYVERYLVHVAVGLMLLVGAATAVAWRRPSRSVRIATAVILLACVTGLVQLAMVGNYNFQRLQRPRVDQAVKAAVCDQNTAIVAADPYVMIELAAYLPGSCTVRFYSDTERLRGGYAPLDQSPQQFGSTAIPHLAPTIYYVYYDLPKLAAPAGYTNTVQQFDGLSVATLRAR